MSADERLSEAEAWGSFILNSGQKEVQITIWKFSYHLPYHIREINGFLWLTSVDNSYLHFFQVPKRLTYMLIHGVN